MVEELPIDRLYDIGVNIDWEESMYDQLEESWNPKTDIDWEQTVSLNRDERTLLAFLATEFHYDNMFELMLCGRIIEQEVNPQGKIVAVMLANAKIRNAGAWGRYLDKLGETVDLSHAKRNYFSELYQEDNNTALLLGVSVIGDVSWYAFMDKVDDVGDPLFQQIVSDIREQKRGQITHTVNYLREAINESGSQEQIAEQAAFFRDKMGEIIRSHHDKLDAVGKDADAIATHVTDYVDTYFLRLNLDVERPHG